MAFFAIAILYNVLTFYNDHCKPLTTKQFRKNINNPKHYTYVKCNSNMCKHSQFVGDQIKKYSKKNSCDIEHIKDKIVLFIENVIDILLGFMLWQMIK